MAVRTDYDGDSFGQTYFNYKGEEIYVPKGDGFELSAISQDEDTEESYYGVKCRKLGKEVEFEVPFSDAMDTKKLMEYQKRGMPVNDSNKKLLPEVFKQKEAEYINNGGNVTKRHSQAGIKECEDENGTPIIVYAGAENPVNGSKYQGRFDIEPKGDRDIWFTMAARRQRNLG